MSVPPSIKGVLPFKKKKSPPSFSPFALPLSFFLPFFMSPASFSPSTITLSFFSSVLTTQPSSFSFVFTPPSSNSFVDMTFLSAGSMFAAVSTSVFWRSRYWEFGIPPNPVQDTVLSTPNWKSLSITFLIAFS